MQGTKSKVILSNIFLHVKLSIETLMEEIQPVVFKSLHIEKNINKSSAHQVFDEDKSKILKKNTLLQMGSSRKRP